MTVKCSSVARNLFLRWLISLWTVEQSTFRFFERFYVLAAPHFELPHHDHISFCSNGTKIPQLVSPEEHLEGYLWKKIDVNVNAVLMALPRTSGTPHQNSVYKLEFASKFIFVRSVFYIIGMETVITFDLGVGQREIFFIVHKIIFLRKGISGGRFLEPFFFNVNLENFWRYFD